MHIDKKFIGGESKGEVRQIDGPLDDTVPAKRSITLRDLLTFRLGIGAVLAPPGSFPIQKAIETAGLAPGPNPPIIAPDEWMSRLSSLPLVHQPGESWMYHTGSDILGVLLSRASGMTLEQFLTERLFTPFGMMVKPGTGELVVHDGSKDSRWANPAFESGGGGLVSTVELMTSDQLTQKQKEQAHIFFEDHSGWGLGMGVNIRRNSLWSTPGRFGWDGGVGTSGYTDPAENMVGILMTQRMMQSPEPPRVFSDFWTTAYQALSN
ncbi:serine hydrolase domain-containing protein [Brevibacillus centrosporus]|uniref:serine hydrolase domain-containing protein n=1 Tax=Brevibacillus centrosporus TaxID=54910 RepID=UPI003986F674